MDYLALLEKRINTKDDTHQNLQNPEKVGSVGFVGTPIEPLQENITARRLALFRYHEIPDEESVGLARLLIIRDEEQDDRRSCAECSYYKPNGCRAGHTSLGTVSIFTFSRCRGFDGAQPLEGLK